MSDFTISWKKTTRGLSRAISYLDDRISTIEEIQKLLEYLDRRIKAIVYTITSSGIHLGAWDHLRWGRIHLIEKDGEVVAVKIIVYRDNEDEYFSFIFKEAYHALKEWMKYREDSGELIDENSWLMRLEGYLSCSCKRIY